MLNPLAEVFLPSYMKSLESDDKLDNDKVDNLDKGNAFINKCTHFCKKYKKDLLCDVNVDTLNIKINKVGLVAQDKLNDTEFKNTIEIHNQIVQSGYPNYLGCRIPVKSGINVDFFRENLIDYDDEIICEFLQFGAPIGYQGEMLNEGSSKVKNHKGATDFHDEILAYLLKEATYGAIIGPFDKNPFSCHFKISPLNSVYKKDSVERRVILDLSFPPGRSVNDFISKDVYLGERVQLSYPKVDDLVGIIKDKGGDLHLMILVPKLHSSKQSRMAQNKVTFKSENELGDCPGVVTGDPAVTKKGIVVIQEWWGMNEQIIQEAALIAKSGFVTLNPDLYRGKVATDNETAGHYMNDLDWPGAVADIKGAILYLKNAGCTKVGVTGFCMGGALTLASAALVPEVDAAAPFYGIPGKALCDLKNIKCPVQCHFGNLDTLEGFSAPKDQDLLEQTLKETGVVFEFYRYEANHAFTNTTGPNYNKECCDLALKRMCEFMGKNLS
ncbi:carboxymethylenebutenolidase [Mytilus galloprovincialis]|uniref:Carboxymethylenebutenolidase n=1 Tax=Mytilus galloprovincialis TaxID=29158 RepID=A0A8B6H5B1_MYTGA|nr:carboxymethylenebutenolidase [Mytilus galloprovincialis]